MSTPQKNAILLPTISSDFSHLHFSSFTEVNASSVAGGSTYTPTGRPPSHVWQQLEWRIQHILLSPRPTASFFSTPNFPAFSSLTILALSPTIPMNFDKRKLCISIVVLSPIFSSVQFLSSSPPPTETVITTTIGVIEIRKNIPYPSFNLQSIASEELKSEASINDSRRIKPELELLIVDDRTGWTNREG